MKAIVGWSIQVGIVLILGGSLYYIDSMNEQLESKLQEESSSLEQVPLDKLQRLTMDAELNRRQADLEKIRSFVVEKNDLVQVISHIEERAKARDVVIQVPNIQERAILDPTTGLPIPPTGPMRDLEMDMHVTGDPDEIVHFLYDLEHSPYLISLPSWEVSIDSVSGSTVIGGSAAPEDSQEEEKPESAGEATVKAFVTVWNSEDEEANK